MAGRGKEYFEDSSLPSRCVAAAYQQAKTATPPESVVGALVKRTLLDAKDIRTLFQVLHKKATTKSNWTAAHQQTIQASFAASSGGASGAQEDAEEMEVDDNVRRYDESLVGRRCTVLWRPRGATGDPLPSDYYPATVVSFNSKAHKFKFRRATHLDTKAQSCSHTSSRRSSLPCYNRARRRTNRTSGKCHASSGACLRIERAPTDTV